jgi:IclR family transcriptional regulator, acetate operon repressor
VPAKQKPKVPGSTLAAAPVPSEAVETAKQERPARRSTADGEDGLTPASPRLLERTFAMLSLFAAERPEWTTTELSGMAGLPVPTTHRIVVALQRHGFLVRDPATKRFRLGPAAIALGRAALSSADLPTIAGKLLPKLTQTTGETSLLTVPSDIGDTSVCLLRVESPHQLRLSVEPGRALPFHAGASQKSLLAYLPEVDRERIASGRLEKFCTNTIDTRESLLAEIEHIRQRGWAYSYQETNAGVWGVAVTLLDASGHSVASVGIAGPDVRASAASVRLAVGTVAETATEMATVLGLSCSMEPGTVVSSRDIPRQLRR